MSIKKKFHHNTTCGSGSIGNGTLIEHSYEETYWYLWLMLYWRFIQNIWCLTNEERLVFIPLIHFRFSSTLYPKFSVLAVQSPRQLLQIGSPTHFIFNSTWRRISYLILRWWVKFGINFPLWTVPKDTVGLAVFWNFERVRSGVEYIVV